jgi:hypothetical protein
MQVVYLSVKYVASGVGHLDRLPCLISVKHADDPQCRHTVINWGAAMVSPLTEQTQLTKEFIESHGTSFERAIAMVRSELSHDTVIVSMNARRHLQSLQLCKNVHYRSYVDMTSFLKIKKGPRPHYLQLNTISKIMGLVYSIDGRTVQMDELDILQHIHIMCSTPQKYAHVMDLLVGYLNTNPTMESDSAPIYSIDGVCTSAYNERRCSCGQTMLNNRTTHRKSQ